MSERLSHLFLSKGETKTRWITGEGSLVDLFPWFSWFPRFDFLCSLNQSSERRRKGEEASSITWHAWLSLVFLRFGKPKGSSDTLLSPYCECVFDLPKIQQNRRERMNCDCSLLWEREREISGIRSLEALQVSLSHQMLFPTCFYQPNIRLLYPLHSPLWSTYFRPSCLGNIRKAVVQLHEVPDVVISPFGSR